MEYYIIISIGMLKLAIGMDGKMYDLALLRFINNDQLSFYVNLNFSIYDYLNMSCMVPKVHRDKL